MKKNLRPEFYNRIDEIIVFHPLTLKEVEQIAKLQIRELEERLARQRIKLIMEEKAYHLLAKEGYDPAFGARPLKRTIQRILTNPLAKKILAEEFKSGDMVEVVVKENSLDFRLKTR